MLDLFVNVFLSIPLVGAFAMFALGIGVIYRASRVLNLAHGAMAMIPSYVFYSLVRARVPMPVALVAAIAAGAGLGVAVERVFVRRLRPQGPTAQTVGTVAVAGLLIAFAAKVWGTTPIIAPRVFPAGELRIAGAAVRYGDIGLFVVGIVVCAGLFAFFKFTEFGLAMRGAAQNRRAATLMGIDPDQAAAAAWALGGGVAALAGVLLAAVTNLDPYNLSLQVLPAFVAALIGGLESLLGVLVGAVIAGLAFGLVPTLARLPVIGFVLRRGGASQLVLTVLALVVLAVRGRRLTGAESESGLASGSVRQSLAPKRLSPPLVAGIAAVLVLLPWIVPFSFLGDALLAIELALVALSLVVLTGWVGQISLAQASFVGMGALIPALAARSLGWSFPATVVLGAFVGASVAGLLGMVALRVRGLYLAVATLIFAWMADQFLFPSPWLGASGGTSGIPNQRVGQPGNFLSLDLTSRTVLYFIFLAILIVVIVALANLRETKTGRAFFAIRGSEVAAASLGIDVVRTKLVAFALSGLLAGLAGSVLITEQRTVVPAQFLFTVSLQYLAIAVVGGLGSLGGAVASGILFAGLNELFFQVRALAGWLEVVSAGLLGVVLLAYPGGLAAVPDGVRRLLERTRMLRPRGEPGASRVSRVRAGLAAAPAALRRVFGRSVVPPVLRRTLGVVGARVRRGVRTIRMPLGRAARTRARRAGGAGADAEEVAPPGSAAAEAEVLRHSGDWYAAARASMAAPASNGSEPSAAPAPVEPAAPSSEPDESHRVLQLDLTAARRPALAEDRARREPLLQATGIVVQFGGLRAVKGASLTVCDGEIVGLIGPNGAGKTTFFNAVLGLNDPVEGTVRLYGKDVSAAPPHVRARMGLTRTFQVIQLFNELTVFDNLLVATHLHNDSGLVSHLTASRRTVVAEREARDRVREILHLLRLDEFAYESVRGLPFGILRMVELGRSLVTGSRLMMLDEPVSGLNEAETDRFLEVVRGVRDLGVSVLLIEHDVRAVTGISDYIYVLEQGALIAEGTPAEVQRNPSVIAAYLGGAVDPAVSAGAIDSPETVRAGA